MNKFSVYLVAAAALWSYHAFGMEEKINKKIYEENVEINIHDSKNSEESEEKPLRIITIVPENEEAPDFITVGEYNSIALTASRARDSNPIALRLYDLINDKLIKEFKPNGYELFSQGTVTLKGPFIILKKNDAMKKGKKPFYLCNVATEDIKPIDCVIEEDDDLSYFDDKSSIDSISGAWKAIAIPNAKERSRVIICDHKNDTKHTFKLKSSSYVKTYLSPDADFIIINVSDEDTQKNQFFGLANFDLYDITEKTSPKLIKTIDLKSFYCYLSQKSNIFCDYKTLYDAKTGEIIEKPDLEENESVVGFSKNYYVFSNQGKKTLIRYNKNNRERNSLQLITDSPIALKAIPINEEKEFVVYPMFPWENKPKQIFVYAASQKSLEKKNNNSGYFSKCVIN